MHSHVQWRFIAADGVEMPLEEGTSAFITMNPGYIGRAELPESLKALFRPITVVVPDRQLIMENMLMAEGFETAKVCLLLEHVRSCYHCYLMKSSTQWWSSCTYFEYVLHLCAVCAAVHV